MVRFSPLVAQFRSAYRSVTRRSPSSRGDSSPFLAAPTYVSRTPHLTAMHYLAHGTDLHLLWPGAPFTETGTTRHLHWLAPGTPVGQGLTWFEFSDATSVAASHAFLVVSLSCPISDALDSPAGAAALSNAMAEADHRGVQNIQIRRTPHGLLGFVPGTFDVETALTVTRVLHRVATAL